MATLQYTLVTAFSLVLLVLCSNVLLGLYMRAAVRDALDDGVRAALVSGAPLDACERRIDSAVRALVRGSLTQAVRSRCEVVDGVAVATARVRVPSFVPLFFAGWTFTSQARAQTEDR